MSPKKTLILAAILSLATLYLYKVSIPSHREAATTKQALEGLEASRVAGVTIVQTGQPGFDLAQGEQPKVEGKKEGAAESDQPTSVWEISQLKGLPLDSTEVDSLVTALLGLAITGPLDEKAVSKDFSEYGLDKPSLTMVLHDRAGADTEIGFGKENAFLSTRYVKVSGRSGIYMVPQESFSSLNKSSKDLRSKNPLEFKVDDVREISLASAAGAVKLTQPVVGEWKIVEPKDLSASKESVEALVEAVGALSVSEFLDGKQADLAAYRLDRPEVRVDLTLRPGLPVRSRSISVSSADDGKRSFFTFAGAPSVFKAESNHVPFLAKGVDDLRENKLFFFSYGDIESLRSTTADGSPPVEIKVNRTDWDVNGKESDPMFVEQLLQDIVNLRASGFPEQASLPANAFNNPMLTLAITKKGDTKESLTLFVGAEAAGKSGRARYAKVGETGTVVLIPDIEAKRVVPHEEALLQGRPAPTIPPFPKGGSLSSGGKDS